MAFRWNGAGPYPEGATFVKIAAGIPGDRVTRIGRAYYINDAFVGVAKTHSDWAARSTPPPQAFCRPAISMPRRRTLIRWILDTA